MRVPSWALKPQAGESDPVPVPPRIFGYDEPYYSVAAKDSFVEALVAASHVLQPHLAYAHENPVRKAQEAFDAASLRCNPALADELAAYRKAVFGCVDGIVSPQEVAEAKDRFTKACRIALGTES